MSGTAAAQLAEVALQHARAVEQYNLGTPARALRTLHRALARLELAPVVSTTRHSALAARIWISIALNESEVNSFDRGLRALATAEQYAIQAADPAVDVLLHCQRGLIELRGGNLARSLSSLNEAVRLLDHAQPRDQSSILLNRGTLRLFEGRLVEARIDLQRAVTIARAAGLGIGEFKALHNLGYLEFLAGELPRSLGLMDALTDLQVDVSRGVALLDRARILAEAGLTREADAVLADAAAIFRRDRLGQDLAETDLERARCALIAGDVASARRFAAGARDRFRRRGNDRGRRSAEMVLLQGDLAIGRPGSRLVEPAVRLRAELIEEGLRLPARTAGLIAAEAHLAAGDATAAAAVVDAIGATSRRDPITARLHSRYVQARLAAARDDARTAARQVRTGLDELSAYQASFGSIDLQTASAIHGRRLAEFGLSLALQSQRPAAVFAAAERARAVSTRLPVVRPPEDSQTAELLAELRQAVESLRAQTQDQRASVPLSRRRRELERAITARGWTLAGAGAARPTAHLAQIRAAVAQADATMVVLVEAGATMHAVVLASGRLRLHHLGAAAAITEQVRRARADLDVLARSGMPGALCAAVRSSFESSVGQLDAGLLAPLDVDSRRLIIISTGILGQLPWGTLPSLHGVPVVVAPSATSWLAAVGRPARAGRPDVVAVAGPALARAEHEISGVGRAWPKSSMLVGDAANRLAVARGFARGTVVHVAAHGVHQTENPLFSSLRLVDGPMFAHEVDQTARTPEHVVLSACELGLATVRPGDEALGLTSVLLHLGTRSVIAGVARVGDDIAAETMIAYHQRLAGGQDSAAALAEAASASSGSVPFVCFGGSWRASH